MDTQGTIKPCIINYQSRMIVKEIPDVPMQTTGLEAIQQVVTIPIGDDFPNISSMKPYSNSSLLTDIVLDNGSSATLIASSPFLLKLSGGILTAKEFVFKFSHIMQIPVDQLDPQGIRSVLLYMLTHQLATIRDQKIVVSRDAGVFGKLSAELQLQQGFVTPEALHKALLNCDDRQQQELSKSNFTEKSYTEAHLSLLVSTQSEYFFTLQKVGEANPISIQDPLLCHISSAALATAVNLGIFEAISLAAIKGKLLTLEELMLPEILNPHISELPRGNIKLSNSINPKGLRLLLNNLIATGILVKNNQQYRFQADFDKYLCRFNNDEENKLNKVGYIHLINGPGFMTPAIVERHFQLSNREKSNQMMASIMNEELSQFLANGMHGLSKSGYHTIDNRKYFAHNKRLPCKQ